MFEGEGQRFVRVDSNLAKGAGSGDMKGGDAVILYALKAVQSIGALALGTVAMAEDAPFDASLDARLMAKRNLPSVECRDRRAHREGALDTKRTSTYGPR